MSHSETESAFEREIHRLDEELLQKALDRVEQQYRREGKAFWPSATPRSGPWCKACGDLRQDAFSGPHNGILEFKTEFGSIRDAAFAECMSCSILWTAISRLAFPGVRSASLHMSDQTLPRYALRIKYHLVNTGAAEHFLELYALPDKRTKWDAFGWENRRNVSDDSGSVECMALVRDWLAECDQFHPTCRSGPSELPSRVLYVGELQPRLHISKGEVSNYIALSHRWGHHRPIITEKATLADRTRCIPYFDLPQQFKDAVTLTRALGIHYLWIDSLCIVQDDRDDWEEHAAMMGRIYANSYVTISADDMEDSRAAMLGPRDGRALGQVPIPAPGPNGEAVNVYARVRVDLQANTGLFQPPVVRSTAHGLDLAHPPSLLDTRGWTFQERLLAPRTLHYTSSELAFECRSGLRCECSTQASGDSYAASMLFKNQAAPGSPGFSWPAVVEGFAGRDLTVPADRLHAIAGVAAAMAPHLPPRDYLFGLWRSQLKEDLLWEVLKSAGGSWRNDPGYAPTWSWASVTGAIAYQSDHKNDGDKVEWAKVVDVAVDRPDAKPYGPGAGSIALRGVLGPATVTRIKMSKRGPSVSLPQWFGTAMSGTFRLDCPEAPEVHVGEEVVAFVLLRVNRLKLDSRSKRFAILYCIVLRAVAGRPGTFCRVGLASLWPSAAQIRLWRGSRTANVTII